MSEDENKLTQQEKLKLEKEAVRLKLVEVYLEFIKENNSLPSAGDLIKLGFTRDRVRSLFGNYTALYEFVREHYSDVFHENITTADSVLNPANRRRVEEKFDNHKTFVVTTAVGGKPLYRPMYDSIKNFNSHNDAMMVIIPCGDVKDTFSVTVNDVMTFPPSLRDEYFVNDEVALNSNLFISNIKVSAKQIKPTTGLSRIGQSQGSYIFASPKQFLEFVATSPNSEYSKAIMTTGAITVNDYSNDLYMSQRTSYIAEHDHVYGGVIVEIVNDRIFHFRHFQVSNDGSFCDLGYRYHPDGRVTKEKVHMYAGDFHAGHTNSQAYGATIDLCNEIEVEDFIVGDFFDGYSISHHHMNRPLKMARKYMDKLSSLEEEFLIGGKYINDIHNNILGSIVMVRGNHDEFLERYLDSGNYTKDYTNMYAALELAKERLDGNDPLQEGYMKYGDIREPERIIWLKRDQSFPIGNLECGQHGDLGANGSKASLGSLEKSYGRCVVGHNHGAAIMRGVYRVGTLTDLILDYNRGPSSWTHTNALVNTDGTVQLINIINGQCHNSKFLNTIRETKNFMEFEENEQENVFGEVRKNQG